VPAFVSGLCPPAAGLFFPEYILEDVRSVGNNSVYLLFNEKLQLRAGVGRPGKDLETQPMGLPDATVAQVVGKMTKVYNSSGR
jgi:hypothetical protein